MVAAWVLAACVEGNPDFGSQGETGGGEGDSTGAADGSTTGNATDVETAGGSGSEDCGRPYCLGPETPWAIGFDTHDVAVGHFNADRFLDLAVGYEGGVFALLGDGEGNVATISLLDRGAIMANRVAVADIGGDETDDVVYCNSANDVIVTQLGNPSGIFADPVEHLVGTNPNGVALGDVNDDGEVDLIAAITGTNNLGILVADGGGGYNLQQVTVQTPTEVLPIDANDDGLTDIAVVYSGATNGLEVRIADTWETDTYLEGRAPVAVASGDFNEDGITDLVVAVTDTDELQFLDGTAGRAFVVGSTISLQDRPRDVAVGDLDGDGILDLVTANDTATTGVMRRTDDGLVGITRLPLSMDASSVAMGDLDGNGRDDIAFTFAAVDGGVTVMLSL